MHSKFTKTLAIAAFFAGSLASANAMADCSEFGNEQWSTLYLNLVDAYDKGDLDGSLEIAKQLSAICDESPIVNYTMSEIFRKKDMQKESYLFVKRASEYLKEYAVPQQVVERIWFRRAEFEAPAMKETKDKLAETETKLANSESKLAAAVAQNESDRLHIQLLTAEHDEALKSLETIKWTGMGIAIGGAVVAGAGAALTAVYHPKADDELKKPAGGKFNDYNLLVQTGVGMIAGGLALGVAGTVFAVYSHVKISKTRNAMSGEDKTLSFSVSPTSVGLQLSF